jgi:hypothetical protein
LLQGFFGCIKNTAVFFNKATASNYQEFSDSLHPMLLYKVSASVPQGLFQPFLSASSRFIKDYV